MVTLCNSGVTKHLHIFSCTIVHQNMIPKSDGHFYMGTFQINHIKPIQVYSSPQKHIWHYNQVSTTSGSCAGTTRCSEHRGRALAHSKTADLACNDGRWAVVGLSKQERNCTSIVWWNVYNIHIWHVFILITPQVYTSMIICSSLKLKSSINYSSLCELFCKHIKNGDHCL